MHRVTPDIGTVFHPVEEEMRDAFLPALFQGATYQIPRRAVNGPPVKQAGIYLPEPTQTTRANWTASCVITGQLVVAFCVMAEF